MKTIKDTLGDKYPDFLEYCIAAEKIYPIDISPSDYVAFRVQYGVSRDYISKIKDTIINGESIDIDIVSCDEPKNDMKSELINDCHEDFVENTLAKTEGQDLGDTEKDCIEQDDLIEELDMLEDNDAIQENNKIKHNKGVSYNIHTPLYSFFEIENMEVYANIEIEAIDLKSKVVIILKEIKKDTVLDLLKCTLIQLIDVGIVVPSTIPKFIARLETFFHIDVNSCEMKLRRTDTAFYLLFNITDVKQYSDVSTASIQFSTRFARALKQNRVFTLYDLLQLNIGVLQTWDYLGATSIKEAIIQLDKYLNTSDKKVVKIKDESFENQKARKKVASIIDAQLNGETVFCDDLEENELDYYYKIKDAIDICGKEFYVEIKNNPNYAKRLAEVLREFYVPILATLEKKNKIFQDYCSIPLEFRYKSAKLLYKVYELRVHCKIELFDRVDDLMTLSEFVHKVEQEEIVDCYQQIGYFLQWIKNINVNNIVKNIFSKNALTGTYKVDECFKDKYWLVLEMRAEGETLENIGSLTDSTRERVRQIEKKYTKLFAMYYKNNEYDLLAVMHALRGGDNVLSKSEVQAIIGEKYTNLLWLVLSKELLDCDLYRYSKEYNAVIFIENNKNSTENLRLVLKELPEMFVEGEFEEIVDDLSQKYGVSKELIIVDIERLYTKFGKIYSQSTPTVIFMCQYILKMKFPNGFKTGDDVESKRFQLYLAETFGENKGKMTQRALDANIGEVGVLCDRGKYIHPDYLHVEKWIIDEINAYIETNEKTVVSYAEVFDELRTVLSGSQITNRFILQGALKFYGCKYKLTRDYIIKEEGRSITNEFEDFAKEYGEFHKSDFFAAFPSMTDANLGMLVGRSPNVFGIDSGYYMHSSVLKLIDKDYDDIRKYLDNVCSNGPLNSRYLFEEFSCRFIDFMSRNEISNHAKLFGILNYMFGNEFVFSRPYISKGVNESLTNRDVLLRYLEGLDTITIEDIIAICQERGIRYISGGYLIRQLSPNFIRINETTLMRYELTGINDDVILEVATYVASCVKTNKYCSVATIKDFLWFPTISIEWTSYLVESIMYLSGDIIGRINIPTTNMANITSVYVSEEYAEDDYVTFVLKIIDDAFEKGFFISKIEMREFLTEKGLINNNLPGFLEGTEYYYVDEEGILKRRR